jgi:uncharacterized membrane protein YphA (DoxX/SURF4 family)
MAMNSDRVLLLLRLVSGGVFVVFGIGKFVNHPSELASFKTYGLPAPAAFVVVIGLIELGGRSAADHGRLDPTGRLRPRR